MKLGTILNKSIHYCNYRERSLVEIKKFIDKFNIDVKEKQFIINYLLKEKYIDVNRYTREYIISKFKINKWGKNRIVLNLKKQNIDDANIDNEWNIIDDLEYANTLKNILLKKKESLYIDNMHKSVLKQKLIRYALYKGFEADIINKELNEIM